MASLESGLESSLFHHPPPLSFEGGRTERRRKWQSAIGGLGHMRLDYCVRKITRLTRGLITIGLTRSAGTRCASTPAGRLSIRYDCCMKVATSMPCKKRHSCGLPLSFLPLIGVAAGVRSPKVGFRIFVVLEPVWWLIP